jgi:HAD superfamily hydrolase (TIGR01549 family)
VPTESAPTESAPTESAPIRSVPIALFDLDNTLYDRESTFRRWATGFTAGRSDPAAEVEWLCEVDGDGMTDRMVIWTQVRRRYGLTASLEELDARYCREYLDTIEPDVQVLEALSRLRERGWRIGVVTNGPVPHQAHKAERLGLLPLVDSFCASDEIGIAKPDPRIFHEAIRRCGGPASNMWMVGDSPLADIGGAHPLGFRTVWIHRGRDWDPAHVATPDHVAGSVPVAIEDCLLNGT